jgi:hypothetical protein
MAITLSMEQAQSVETPPLSLPVLVGEGNASEVSLRRS